MHWGRGSRGLKSAVSPKSATISWSSPPTFRYDISAGRVRSPLACTADLHAKPLIIDDDVALIGSSNLDIRSLSLHMELSVLVHGAKFTAAMRAVEDDYRSKSRQVLLEDWLKRPRRERVFDNLMRLTSSLQ